MADLIRLRFEIRLTRYLAADLPYNRILQTLLTALDQTSLDVINALVPYSAEDVQTSNLVVSPLYRCLVPKYGELLTTELPRSVDIDEVLLGPACQNELTAEQLVTRCCLVGFRARLWVDAVIRRSAVPTAAQAAINAGPVGAVNLIETEIVHPLQNRYQLSNTAIDRGVERAIQIAGDVLDRINRCVDDIRLVRVSVATQQNYSQITTGRRASTFSTLPGTLQVFEAEVRLVLQLRRCVVEKDKKEGKIEKPEIRDILPDKVRGYSGQGLPYSSSQPRSPYDYDYY